MSRLLQQLNGLTKINNAWLRWLFFVISISIGVCIFILSAQPAVVSSNTSSSFLMKIFSVLKKDFGELDFATQNSIIEPFIHFTRKAAHFVIYAALGLFVKLFALTLNNKFSFKLVVSMSACLLYAVSDEIHQIFVSGRSGQFSDVILDFCGSCCGIVFAILIVLIIYKIKSKLGGKVNV